jgi:hypothetical protein
LHNIPDYLVDPETTESFVHITENIDAEKSANVFYFFPTLPSVHTLYIQRRLDRREYESDIGYFQRKRIQEVGTFGKGL